MLHGEDRRREQTNPIQAHVQAFAHPGGVVRNPGQVAVP